MEIMDKPQEITFKSQFHHQNDNDEEGLIEVEEGEHVQEAGDL